MIAARPRPKLSLNINAPAITRPVLSLSLKSPATPLAPSLRSPISPLPMSPTARNTKLNQRGFATVAQQPTYGYVNNSTSRSILKKTSGLTTRRRQIQFEESPMVYCISPIEDAEYYGNHQKMSKEERRWTARTA